MEKLTTKDIIRILNIHKWKMLLIILLSTLLGGGASFYISPTYEVKIDLLVNGNANEATITQAGDIDFNLRLIETYKHISESDRILHQVVSKLPFEYKKEKLAKNIKIESNPNSQILTIIAFENTPQKAAAIVNTYASTFKEEVSVLMNMENISILKEASENDSNKIKPLPILYFIVACVSSTLMCLLIFLMKELYFSNINTVEKSEQSLKINCLGGISVFNLSKNKLIAFYLESYELREELRKIRTNLQVLFKEKTNKSLLVTSSKSGDGRTMVSVCMAISFAKNGKKTLLLDTDFRNHENKKLFDSSVRLGLSNVLTGHFPAEKVIQNTAIENLYYMCPGPIPPDPAELLSSQSITVTIQELTKQYDLIVIDSPPLYRSDALAIAKFVDGCIFVIDSKNTKEKIAKKYIEQLNKLDIQIIGTILNRLKQA